MSDTGLTVVSTTPSGTEICYSLGVEPAAVSHQCDFPPSVADRPRVTRSRGSGDGRDRYAADADLLRDLAPDVIVTQTVCGVCAVDEQLVSEELADLDVDPTLVPLNASDLESVYGCIEQVGQAVERTDRASEVVGQLRDCIEQVGSFTAAADTRPSVVVLEWLDPLRAAGNWVPDLVAAAGGSYPLGDAGERSVELSWERVRETDPDVLVAAPCSLDAETSFERAKTYEGIRAGTPSLPSGPGAPLPSTATFSAAGRRGSGANSNGSRASSTPN